MRDEVRTARKKYIYLATLRSRNYLDFLFSVVEMENELFTLYGKKYWDTALTEFKCLN